ETIAIKRVFGEHARKLAVSSTKSMTGHLLGAAGGIEAIATVLALHHGVLPPTINYETPDPECDLDYVPNQARKQDVETALSHACGFGAPTAPRAFRRSRAWDVVAAVSRAVTALEAALGHRFADLDLLERALTHASYVNEHPPCIPQDGLAFVGDA